MRDLLEEPVGFRDNRATERSATEPSVGLSWESPDEVSDGQAAMRAAVRRVIESRHFHRAPLLSAFLTYVCETAIEDKTARITEQEIGVRVFRRAEGYDPGEDNIVRNYARQLRRRLEQYYREEGSQDELRIEIPKGGYVAVFHRQGLRPDRSGSPLTAGEAQARELATDELPREDGQGVEPLPSEPPSDQEMPSSGIPFSKKRWFSAVAIACYSLLLIAGTAYAVRRYASSLNRSPLHPLWSQIFQSDRDTVVIPADVGFVILQQMNNRTYDLAEYESWPSVEKYDHVYQTFLKTQKYTSMLDLETVARIERLPEVVPNRFYTRAAHSLSMEDLSADNVILLGSNYSNPWVGLIEHSLNFHFVNRPSEGRSWIENTHPLPGEAASYENTTRNIQHETYAVIALLPNLSHSGRLLVIEGLDGSGTQAAVDMLMQGDPLRRVIAQATRPGGGLGSFEVLLAATSLDSRATGTHILAERYYR